MMYKIKTIQFVNDIVIWGKIIFGDLMFESREYENMMKNKYPDLVDYFNDELYWYIDEESQKIESLWFVVNITKFSDLTFGIYWTIF